MDNTGYPVADILIAYAWPIAFAVAAFLIAKQLGGAMRAKAEFAGKAVEKERETRQAALDELKTAAANGLPGAKEAIVLSLASLSGLPMTKSVLDAVKGS